MIAGEGQDAEPGVGEGVQGRRRPGQCRDIRRLHHSPVDVGIQMRDLELPDEQVALPQQVAGRREERAGVLALEHQVADGTDRGHAPTSRAGVAAVRVRNVRSRVDRGASKNSVDGRSSITCPSAMNTHRSAT